MISRFVATIYLFVLMAMGANASLAYDVTLAESSKCSRYFSLYEQTFHMPSNLIRAVGNTESGQYVKSTKSKMAWPWTVNAQGKGYYFRNKREAIRAVETFRSKGIKSIDVGCMQVNLMYHPEAFRNLEQAFEPKYNIGYAAKFLKDKYLQARNWRAAIGLYHNGNTDLNKEYIKRVYREWRQVDSSVQVASLGESFISLTDASNLNPSIDADVSALTKNVLATFDR